MKFEPCFSCPLPDCDDKDRRCPVRRLNQAYDGKKRRRQLSDITPEEREGMNSLFSIWLENALADASEGKRPWPARFKPSRPSVAAASANQDRL